MSIKSSRTNDDHLNPRQRRRAIILLLAAGLVRMHGGEKPLEESTESRQKALGFAAETRPFVPVG